MKVLIVDDTVFMRMTIRRILEDNGITVVAEAADGYEAIAKYKKYHPDLTIMDISMPKMDGIEAVKQIIHMDATAQIIMCSLQGQRANVMEAIKAGAKSYLVKPVKEEKLLLEIQKQKVNPSAMNIITRNLLSTKTELEPLNEVQTPQAVDIQPENPWCELSLADTHSDDFIQGLEQGYLESKREIATNMIRAGISLELIIACVELSEEDIRKFKEEYKL